MPYCLKRKIYWYTPARTGSRTIAEVLEKLDFESVRNHNYYPNARKDGFFQIWSVRNPYSRLVSLYNQKRQPPHYEKNDFEVWLKNKLKNDYLITKQDWDNLYVYKQKDKPDMIVRMENFKNDLLQVDFIKENFNYQTNSIFGIDLETNRYSLKIENNRKFYDFYNEELVDLVYENLKHEFELFGYNKDYIKDGTP